MSIFTIIFLVLFTVGAGGLVYTSGTRRWKAPSGKFPAEWRNLLVNHVPFYERLDAMERTGFEYKVHEFLDNVVITGIKTKVEDLDRILVASSAIIPIFAFPEWQYLNLQEVLLYRDRFNKDFKDTGPDRNILGMVGSGYMEGKMILSRQSLRFGFQNETDKKNTAIHEFVHLIDKADGQMDGVPSALLEKQYVLPWFHLIEQKIAEIEDGKTDINPYGATSRVEFFAVLSEYFFERPKLLKQRHPELYKVLMEIFEQDLSKKNRKLVYKKTGRNDPCPCGSGEKFKRCCQKL